MCDLCKDTRNRPGSGFGDWDEESAMTRRTAAIITICCLLTALNVDAQDSSVRRTPWGDPDFEGIWTNATLTPLQRPPELGTKEFFTADEAAQFQRSRLEQTNADRPLPHGQVGAYNDAFFERGTSIVRRR